MKGLIELLLGKQQPEQPTPEVSIGPEYDNWQGPWLKYNGERFPLDIPELEATPGVTVEVDVRPGRCISSVSGGSMRNCSLSTTNSGAYLNGVNLDAYVARFKKENI